MDMKRLPCYPLLIGNRMHEPLPAKAVVKTMRILECLSRERSFGISEIARLVSADSAGR